MPGEGPVTDREYLLSIRACGDALEWLGDRSIAEAWLDCPRGEWMLWWAPRCPSFVANGDLHRRIGLAACEIARTALVHVPADDLRPLRAIETTERFWRGEVTLDEVARAAAWGSTRATRAAWAAAEATRAAGVAWAAAAAWAEVDWEASAKAHRQYADIVRRYISAEEIAR